MTVARIVPDEMYKAAQKTKEKSLIDSLNEKSTLKLPL